MKFSFSAPALAAAIIITTLSLFHCLPVYEDTASFDTTFDNGTLSLNSVTCSSLAARYTTLSEIPNFPYIAAATIIKDLDSPLCGECLSITYTKYTSWGAGSGSNNLSVTLIHGALNPKVNFVLSGQAFNVLTGGYAELGEVPVVVSRLPASECGMA